jgi:hypothetical protein
MLGCEPRAQRADPTRPYDCNTQFFALQRLSPVMNFSASMIAKKTRGFSTPPGFVAMMRSN